MFNKKQHSRNSIKIKCCESCNFYQSENDRCKKSNLNRIASYLKIEKCYAQLNWWEKLIAKIYSHYLTLE